jgi:cobaltochelatase CobS subunit
MTPTQSKLRSALAIDDFTAQRKALRELFTSVATTEFIDVIRTAIRRARGDGHIPDSVTQTLSSIRDNLDVTTLAQVINLDASDYAAQCIADAIINPAKDGFASKRAKSGYVFGRPKHWGGHLLASIQHDLDSMQTEVISMLNLTDAVAAYDYVLLETDCDHDEIVDVLKAQGLTDETIAGVSDLVHLREPDHLPKTSSQLDISEDAKNFAVGCVASLEPDASAPELPATIKGYVSKYPTPDTSKSQLIDLTLAQAGLPDIKTLIGEIDTLSREVAEAHSRASEAAIVGAAVEETPSGDGSIPSGKVVTKPAHEAFGLTRAKDVFAFKVPVWEWDGDHPHVPEVDEDYVFRPFELLRVLFALISNQRCYLHGHTGSGKTTLIEQVAARLNWPFMRVNFDSEITRMDLIGRDVLTNEGGVTASKFVDGILPQMMSGPYIGCFDEIDYVRPDVAYVMQRALEGNGLMLTEDGGRMVKPHKLFRMFATGNTVGQGDEFGMYQGARPQSMAFLDRFTVWVKVDYLKPADRKRLIKARLPKLGEDMVEKLNAYVTEHLEAFTTSKVMQPISPRGFLSLGQAVQAFLQFYPEAKQDVAVNQAIETVVLDRASVQDRAVLKGIAQRVFG